MQEVWKDIPGYWGLYKVSSLGNVKSLRYGMIMTPSGSPYKTVTLSRYGVQTTKRVHRLVAEAFVENPHGYKFVNHKDENKANNAASNLEWCTHQQNCRYSYELHPDRIKCLQTEEAARKRILRKSRRVEQRNLETGEVVKVYASAKEAGRQTGFSQGDISSCCRGRYKQAYGYVWNYLD